MRLSELLPSAQIRVPLVATTKQAAIDELLAAVRFQNEAQRAAARDAVLARERESSTGIGRGVAVPHGRTRAVNVHHCAFGVAAEPIEFDAIDGVPCRLFFLCVSGEEDAAAHVRVLSQVAHLLNDPRARTALEAASTSDEVRNVLLKVEARGG